MSSKPRDERLLKFAREMRKNMTPEERKLWYMYLQKHPKHRFRHQEIIGSYIADFYCAQAKLIIEVDGSQHSSEEAMAYDEARTEFFQQQNLRVIRFTNADINQRFTNVCETIEQYLIETSPAREAGRTRDS